MPIPLITLTTDFGLEDSFVGVMKGVILSRNPAAQIIDLSHSVPPHNTLHAAYLIHANFCYFPKGTLHLIIVDPGVGSTRKIVLAEACGHLFLAPDNGVLSQFILQNQVTRAFYTDREDLYLTPTSHTFHGRDIFAPLAAFLTNGNPPKSIGPECKLSTLTTLDLPCPQFNSDNSSIEGVIINVDHFGNLITNISRNDINTLNCPAEALHLIVNSHTITGLQKNYAATPHGKPLLLINSQNCLEIAVNQGNAQTTLNTSLNAPILITKKP